MPSAGIRAPRHSGGSRGWWPDPLTPSKGPLFSPATCAPESRGAVLLIPPPSACRHPGLPEPSDLLGPPAPSLGPRHYPLDCLSHLVPRRWHLPPPLKLQEPGPPARKLRCSLSLQDETSPEPDGAPGPASQPSPAPTRPMPISLCGAPAEVGWECPAPSLPEAPSLPKQLLLVPDLDWPLLGAPAGACISPSSHDPSPQELWRIGACAWL